LPLYHFFIKSNEIQNPQILFEQRIDREASKLLIEISENDFIDKKGYNLKKHLVNKQSY
jgi:hypothetical protein